MNGRFSPELSRTSGLPAGVQFGSLATAVDRTGRRRRRATSASSPTPNARAFAALNTAFTHDGAYVYVPDGARLRAAAAAPVRVDVGRPAWPTMSHPRDAHRAPAIAARCRSSRPTSARRGRSTSPTRSPRSSPARTPCSITTRSQEESIDAFHVASMHIHAARSSNVSTHSFTLGGAHRPQRHHRGARRRGRRVHAERAVPRRRRAAGRHPHDDRSRQAALPEPRDLQGHSRRQRPRASSTARSSSGRTRRRPTRSRRTGRCCCRTTRRSTPSRSSRSSPTT